MLKKTERFRLILFSIAGGLLASVCPSPAQSASGMAPRAEAVLRSACEYLAQAPYFGLTAEVWREHVTDDGQKLQYVRDADMQVKRPGQLHAEIHSAHSSRGFWFDGKTLTVLDRKHNFYSTASVPGTLDKALDQAREQFGIDLPLVDLALSDPYKNAIARVRKGTYLGLSTAMGYTCHHLAFEQENIDWQVWIQQGPQPLIRKFVITHKQEPASPEFTALITSWNLADRIAPSEFVFVPPEDARKVPMEPEVAVAHTPWNQPGAHLASPHQENP